MKDRNAGIVKLYRITEAVSVIGDAVFCVLIPPALLGGLGYWLCGKFAWPQVWMIPFLLAGLAIGAYSAYTFLARVALAWERAEEGAKRRSRGQDKGGMEQ